MTRTTQPEPSVGPPAAPTLDGFFEHVRYSNPFAVNRVVPTALLREDAPHVHHRQFTRLVELAARAQKQHVGVGVMLWGEAGIGKSHLLARLENWAGPEHKQAVFVPLANLQAAPEQLPRCLLRAVVSILTRGRTRQFLDTPLFRLVMAAVRHALEDDGSRSRSWAEAEAAYEQLIDQLCDRAPAQAALVDRAVYGVLFRFFRSTYSTRDRPDDGIAARAVRWLAGDPLDLDEARQLGLPPGPRGEEGVALADDEQIKKVLIALAQLASYRPQPLILCFDQVDSLAPEQLTALTRFQHALLDSAANLLLITSGVRETIVRWEEERVIQSSTWDRLGQEKVEVQRVSVAEARQIVQARLQPFQESFLALAPVKGLVQKDYLFPLGETWAREFLEGKMEVRPRDVINWASEGWRRQQEALRELGGAAWLAGWETRIVNGGGQPDPPPAEIQKRIDDKVSLKVQELKQQRQLEAQTLPPDGDNLAGLLHTLLRHCLKEPAYPALRGVDRLDRPRYGQRPPLDLVLRQRFDPDGKESRSGLLCLVVGNRTSMTSFLRRLAHDPQPPDRLCLIADERRPLEPGAAGREYLEQVRKRHGDEFHQVNLTFDEYAELDALQAVVGLARSGDLEIELPGGRSRRVQDSEVIQSHHRRERFLAHPLLRLLLAQEMPAPNPGPSPRPPTANGPVPNEQDLRQFIMGRLAITMGASSRELAVQYHDYLERKQTTLDPAVCKTRLEEVARQLHQEGRLNATPHDDYLFLLSK
jgi:hypothetical protein